MGALSARMVAMATVLLVLATICVMAEESQQEQRVLATRKTKIDGIGMSGSAFMVPYHLGVAKTFLEYGMFKKFKTAGASGGAISASVGCSGISHSKLKQELFAAVDACSKDSNHCIGTLGNYLSEALEKTLPKDASFKKCRNRLFVQVTIGTTPDDPNAATCACTETDKNRGKIVRFYKDRADFVSTLRTTTFLSRVVAPVCTRKFRKFDNTCDGGYSDNLPCPPGTLEQGKFCLKASVYPKFMWSTKTVTTGPADIYPGVRGNDTLPVKNITLWADITHNPVTVNTYKDAIYDAGRLDAKYWLDTNGYSPEN